MTSALEDNFNLPTLGVRDATATDMMNSFDFNQSPQEPLIEPANFIGPATVPTKTQFTATTTQITTTAQELGSIQSYVFPVLIVVVVVAVILSTYRFIQTKKRPN